MELVIGLQDLWANWNISTPNLDSDLLNWKTAWNINQPLCRNDCPCYNPTANWVGVTCLRFELGCNLPCT